MAAPGIYEGMSFEDYVELPAINHSSLSWLMDESPACFRHRVDQGYRSDSNAKKFGNAAHCATLEPDRFAAEFDAEPDPSQFKKPDGSDYASPRSCKAYKQVVLEMEMEGRTVLTCDEYRDALQVAQVVRTHPRIGPLIKEARGIETVLVWERDGLLCKARLDFWGKGYIGDLKSTRNIGGFSPWDVTKWHYYRQLEFYRSGAMELGLNPEVCYLAAVSSNYPEAALFYLVGNALESGRKELDAGWALYRKCLDSGVWPGRYPDDADPIGADITDRRTDEINGEWTE